MLAEIASGVELFVLLALGAFLWIDDKVSVTEDSDDDGSAIERPDRRLRIGLLIRTDT